jgi:alpha-glucosidase
VNHANELTLKFGKSSSEIDLVVRAYDEGGAYRFAIPGGGSYTVNSETGGFTIPSGTIGWAAPPAADYQGVWDSQTEAQLTSKSWELPVLVKEPSGAWAFVSEAAVYGSVYWGSGVNGQPGVLSLSAGDSNAQVSTPFVTPWRLAMVGTDLARIVESTMIEDLNPPSDLVTDTSWIKSGRSAWSWWSGDSTSDYTVQQQYVDFASSMGWEYYLCDAGWDASWMPMLVEYAAGKNVGIWIWYDGSQLKTDADITNMVSQASGWGAKGIKVDYMFGDDLGDLSKYDKVAAVAAQARLMVNFHGATKPSGERRRWPHNLTREAIYGAEQYKGGGNGPTAKFNCILPFTRNLQGPMDYTPVTYSDMGGLTTYAHQTALDVVFESGVQHLADKPSSYTSNAAQPFLKAVPSRWDDTRLLEGDPGSYATLARRSGTTWFVGSIADAARTANVSLSFLDAGTMYQAQIYQDGSSDTQQAVNTQMVTASTMLTVPVRQHGGFGIQLTPQ